MHRGPLRRVAMALLLLPGTLAAQLPEWPRQIPVENGYSITIYQPQPEGIDQHVVTGRAAIALAGPTLAEPVFGAIFYSAKVEVDKDARVARFVYIKITAVNWPDATDEKKQKFTRIVEDYFAQNKLTINLDELSASMASAEQEQKQADQLNNDPPRIIIVNHLAVLLIYDGEPQFKKIENTNYERVLNTAFAVVRSTQTQDCYLTSGKLWYSAKDPKGPWEPTSSPPADLVKMIPKDTSSVPAPNPPPAIIAATEPTEVIAFDGQPKWKKLPDASLEYAENTESFVIQESSTSSYFVLISGRWYSNSSLTDDTPWEFVRGDQLPPSFSRIPPDSDIGDVRAAIAGTEEAQDALLDAAIPQTAAINKATATLSVQYDGEPQFKDIPGTSVAYAVNTGTQVLKVDDHYYAVDNAVWFEAASAKGPWTIADSIPDKKIQEIPPSAPVYNTTNVHIYESTPEVVYTGYTPGYMGAYPYYGTMVYGTGFYYPPYMSPYYYYPRPATFGFQVHCTSWGGCGVGMSWSIGFMSFGMTFGGYHGCCGGYYGGGRPVNVNNININTGNVNIGNRVNAGNKVSHHNSMRAGNNNVYKRPESTQRLASKDLSKRNLSQTQSAQRAQAQQRNKNNMYADRSGNVYENKGGHWQQRGNSSLGGGGAGTRNNNLQPSQGMQQRPSTPSASQMQSLDRERAARDRGAQRRQMNRPPPQRSAPRPMPRGGGRRR